MTGPEGLGEIDLIALVLGTGAGGRGTRAIAADLLERWGSAAGVAAAPPGALSAIRGVGPARAVRLHAGLALGRRAALDVPPPADPVDTPAAAAAWFLPHLDGLDREELHALLLDRKLRPVGYRRLTAGSDRATVVDPRQVFRKALEVGAACVVVAHNHPSGAATPSAEDVRATAKLRDVGRVVDVALLDHLVVAGGRWTSIAEETGFGGASWRPVGLVNEGAR